MNLEVGRQAHSVSCRQLKLMGVTEAG
jgi:hypothetical protein